MQLLNKTLLFFSFVAIGTSHAEAKIIETVFDHEIARSVQISADIPTAKEESPGGIITVSPYFEQITLENMGHHPVKHCLPFINHPFTFTLNSLAADLAKEPEPALALYKIWNECVICSQDAKDEDCNPLDTLNFHGICSPKKYQEQFLNLCAALGIDARQASIKGKKSYDFGTNDSWSYFNFLSHPLYFSLNNEQIASSEEIMDDPFILLRTKQSRLAQDVDPIEGWKQLAAFDIVNVVSTPPIDIKLKKPKRRNKGFDLYPKEKIILKNGNLSSNLSSHVCSIDHVINLKSRAITSSLEYNSFFPIYALVNNTEAPIKLIEQDIEIIPGEEFSFSNPSFRTKITFASRPKGTLTIKGKANNALFPTLAKGKNKISLGIKNNPSVVHFSYALNDYFEMQSPSVFIENQNHLFDHCSPYFFLTAQGDDVEEIWWQISSDPSFHLVPSNLDQIEDFKSVVTLSPFAETFLNPDTTYYFRVKGYQNGSWSDWSSPFTFRVNKPLAVQDVLFEETSSNLFLLNWERYAQESIDPIEYLVFGSNALDFIPSIYVDKQINAIVNGKVSEEEVNDNLIALTTEAKIEVSGGLAYYRIIARQKGQLSVPSPIIRVYDQDFIQPRSVLQLYGNEGHLNAKRTLFTPSYSWKPAALPLVSSSAKNENKLVKLQTVLHAAKELKGRTYRYELPNVANEVWEEVRSNLLPDNHPAWAKLNRLFCKVRATQTPEHFKKAGFKRWQPGRWSRVAASSNSEFPEYFIKAYCDSELGIIYDWKKWLHRIRGAETIRACIKDYNLEKNFKVPRKWIYPLPAHPAPPNTSQYIRKNFILVCENMRIQEHSTNEKMYKKKMTHELMTGLYTILQVCGLNDSVYVFNMPFCKDGKIAIIDTEYHHKWPVPFHKLTSYFPADLRSYWQKITFNGGKIPAGIPEHNPPRMDRRDVKTCLKP